MKHFFPFTPIPRLSLRIRYRAALTASMALWTVVLFSCVSRPAVTTEQDALDFPRSLYIPQNVEWSAVASGIERFDFENKQFPIRYHAVRINLETAGLSLVCVPNKDDCPSPVFTGIRTRAFAKKYRCTVAMNATPFNARSGKRQLVGVHIAQGVQLASPNSRYAALCVGTGTTTTGSNTFMHAWIVDSQTPDALSGCDYAFGGFFTVLRNSRLIPFTVSTHDTRSGAGIADGGRTLILLVVEGENPLQSKGLSYPQCAELFAALGCTDALEFDGGSSSDLCINGRSVLSYPFTVVQANSFGFVCGE